MNKLNFTVFLLFFLFSKVLLSQNKVQGIVINDKEKAVQFASIIVYDSKKDSVLKTAITNKNGEFNFYIKQGDYIMSIIYLEKERFKKDIEVYNNIDLGKIILDDKIELKGIELYGNTNNIKLKNDRITISLDESYKGNTIDDALRTLPGVFVDANSNISLAGKGKVGILINGLQKRNMTKDQITTYLNSLNAEQVKQIELITTPPAKYSANGSVAMINIILKHEKHNYFKFNERVMYNKYFTNNSTLSYSLSGKKFSILFHLNSYLNGKFQTTNNEINGRIQDLLIKNNSNILSPSISLNYNFSEKLILNFNFYNSMNFIDVLSYNTNKYTDTPTGTKHNIKSKSLTKNTVLNNNSFDFSIVKKINESNDISFIFSYLNYKAPKIINTTNNINDFVLRQEGNQDISNYSASLDFNNKVFKTLDLNYGVDAFITSTNNRFELFKSMSQKNLFKFDENVYSIYLSTSYTFFKKLYSSVQLRLEETNLLADSNGKTSLNLRYLKLFPSISSRYSLSKQTSLSVAYSRRYDRPRFEDMDPFEIYINEHSYAVGNPNLLPSFSHNVDFNLMHKKIMFLAFYNIKTDGFGQIFTAEEDNNKIIYKRENHYEKINYGIGINYRGNISHWSYYMFYVKGYKFQNNLRTDLFNKNTSYSDYAFMSMLRLGVFFNKKKTLYSNINAFYKSKERESIFDISEISRVSLDLKYVPNKQFIFMVEINDIFRTSYPKISNITIPENNLVTLGGYNYQRLTFSLIYTLKGRKDKTNVIKSLNKSVKNRL